MKTILLILIGLTALHGVAQNNVPPPVPPPPLEPFAPPAPANVAPAGAAGTSRPKTIRRAELRSRPAAEADDLIDDAREMVISTKQGLNSLDAALPRSTKTGRTLVIQSSNPDPDALSNAEEDLSVMSLILRKATGGGHREERRMALGIEVETSVFGSSSGARNMYVEGHGVIFLLSVPYPLIAPPQDGDLAVDKRRTSSEWEQAREELLSRENNRTELKLDRVLAGYGRSSAVKYDEALVEELKSSMVEALRNASNIRVLGADDYVTVVIQGGESIRSDAGRNRTDDAWKSDRSESRRGETVMTIRVKKSEVDSFAKGELNADAFRNRAAIQTYFRRRDASIGTSFYFAPSLAP